MRRIPLLGASLLSFALCAGLAGPSGAEGSEESATPRIDRPFLWVFEGEAQAKVYLLGTVHLPATLTGALPTAVTEAIASSDVFFGELSHADMQKQEALVARLQNPDGKGLKDILPAELYQRLSTYLDAKSLPVALLDRMKPWVIAVMIPLLDFMKEMMSGPAMDAAIGSGAVDDKKENGGLETVEEQLGIFEALTDEEEVRFLEMSLDDAEAAAEEGKKANEELLEIYRSGDEAKLAAFVAKMIPDDEMGRRLMVRALDERNVRMADRIVEHAKKRPGKTIFVYVGAAHLPGEKGVIALLEAKGWKAKRVAPKEAPPVTTPPEKAPEPKPVPEPAPVR